MITLCHVFLIIIILNESNRAPCSVDEGGNNELCLSNFLAFHRLNLVKILKPLSWLRENLNGWLCVEIFKWCELTHVNSLAICTCKSELDKWKSQWETKLIYPCHGLKSVVSLSSFLTCHRNVLNTTFSYVPTENKQGVITCLVYET